LRIAYRGQRPALPGVHVTSAAAGTASGYLTLAGAKRFGAELLRLNLADHAAARYGTDGMFAGGLTMGLAGQPGPPAARPLGRPGPVTLQDRSNIPAFQMETLTIRGFDRFGKPDTGDLVQVINADNSNFFNATTFFDKGVAKLSVPVGHYWAVGQYPRLLRSAPPGERLEGRDRAAVHRAPVGRHGHVPGEGRGQPDPDCGRRGGRSRSTRSSTLVRSGRSGPGNEQSFEANGIALWVNPTTVRPTVGKLSVFTEQRLASPPKTRGTGYEYNLATETHTGLIPPSDSGCARRRLPPSMPGTSRTSGRPGQISGSPYFPTRRTSSFPPCCFSSRCRTMRSST